MKIYSHSRLNTFEQCNLKFKLKYIDKIIPEVKETIESHLGKCVHETLEWLYTQVKKKNTPTLDDIILYYTHLWQDKFSEKILIVNSGLTEKNYFNKGIQFLVDYYSEHHPFDDNTLEVEKRIIISLDKDGKYKIIGFIDRLSYNLETKEYEIHDYKTSNSMPHQEKIDNDRQLALYSIAIKDSFGHDKEVCLIWHYLAHNKKIHSRRTNEQLAQLKKETLELIKQIESTTKFPSNKSTLCNWCEYKSMCPEWEDEIKKNSELIDKSISGGEDGKPKEECLGVW